MTPGSMPLCEVWAHCNEPLKDHLESVGRTAESFAASDLKEMARLAGLCHDIGKATTFFQNYLRESCMGKEISQDDARTHHAYFSAVYGAWAASQMGLDRRVIFLVIARHHGHLVTPTSITAQIKQAEGIRYVRSGSLRRELKALKNQLEDVGKTGLLSSLCKALDLPAPDPFLKGEAWRTIGELHSAYQRFDIDNRDTKLFWRINRTFSCLIDADKKMTKGLGSPQRRPIPPDVVDQYVANSPAGGPLARWRKELYKQVARCVQTEKLQDLFPSLLTLTAPTGSGKTLTVLNAALKLRARCEREDQTSPRIIYVLPYINIINQTAKVIRDVLENYSEFQHHPTEFLLEHHHLATLGGEDFPSGASRRSDPDELMSLDDKLLLTEAWDAEIVVTTFVQLFETLVGYRNKSLKKLHNIENSIVILDEVQSLPAEHWNLVRQLLKDLRDLNTTVILMSATQPHLLIEGKELAPKLSDWPSRVTIERESIASLEDLADAVQEARKRRGTSCLVVVNTVQASVRLYRLLRERLGHCVYHLSTNITPYERELRIDHMRCALRDGKENPVVVATQVVEAGVDLDFATGYRELGPVDSIIQVAGRVNRNRTQEDAQLKVFGPLDESSHKVYGRVLLDLTKGFLPSQVTDIELYGRLEKYYRDVDSNTYQDDTILQAIKALRYEDENPGTISEFSLIEEVPKVSIFVELNEEARRVKEELAKVLAEQDPHKRRLEARILRPKVERFTVTTFGARARANAPPPLFDDRPDWRGIPHAQLRHHYDTSANGLHGTGFKWLDEEVADARFI